MSLMLLSFMLLSVSRLLLSLLLFLSCARLLIMSLLPLMYKPYVHSEDGKPCIFVASSLLAVAPHQVPSEILLHPKEKFTNPPCALLTLTTENMIIANPTFTL